MKLDLKVEPIVAMLHLLPALPLTSAAEVAPGDWYHSEGQSSQAWLPFASWASSAPDPLLSAFSSSPWVEIWLLQKAFLELRLHRDVHARQDRSGSCVALLICGCVWAAYV